MPLERGEAKVAVRFFPAPLLTPVERSPRGYLYPNLYPYHKNSPEFLTNPGRGVGVGLLQVLSKFTNKTELAQTMKKKGLDLEGVRGYTALSSRKKGV